VFGLEARVKTLVDNFRSSKYQLRKSKVQQELEDFLFQLGKTIFSCSPSDICLFLVWSDRSGKTNVHIAKCPEIGRRKPTCECPKRLAVGTVASKISQLKAIFSRLGKLEPWSGTGGNPIQSELVSVYQKQIREEQRKGHVLVSQGKPMFVSKLRLISMYIDRELNDPNHDSTSKFILARDQALWKFMFFGGDRASDAGLMLSQEIKRLPENAGFVVRHTWGKTHRVDKPNIF
jgi:hypothetical protein